jgi:hypothetical protein
MDILSHGLWGGVSVGRKSRRSYWWAFFFGVAPDLFSFGIFFLQRLWGHGFEFGRPDGVSIPTYVYELYDVTHSLVTFTVVFTFVWLFMRRPQWVMLAWPLHIVMDIFTHGDAFFPTPFLWPISDYYFNGISWANPYIFFPNVALVALSYLGWWFWRRRKKSENIKALS